MTSQMHHPLDKIILPADYEREVNSQGCRS